VARLRRTPYLRAGRFAFAVVLSVLAGAVAVSPPTQAAIAPDTTETFPTVTLDQVTSSAGFVHPGIGVSADRLLQSRRQVLAGTEPWASYYAAMVSTKYASTTFSSANASNQTDYPAVNAFTSQSVQSRFIDDAFRAYTQAILYVITGNPAFRENGLRIVRIWSHMDPTKYAYYADAHIHSGVPLLRMMAAAELLRYSSVNPGNTGYDLVWQDVDTANLTSNLVEPMTSTFLNSNKRFMNQHLYSLVGALAGAVFTDNRTRYNERVEWFTVNSTNPDPYANGAMQSLIRRIAGNDPLNPYGETFIQHQEMGRDQAHAWDGIAKLSEIARLLEIQGTRLDPAMGTVSTAKNAVSAYRFGHDRLLHGADAFYGYMMGKTIPWIDTSAHAGVLSDAYRGRVFEPIDELYDVYRYDLGADVDIDAPNVAAMAQQADGPTFYWGTGLYNFWNSNPDYNVDYWLSLPPAVAGQARPTPTNPLIQVEKRSISLDDRSAVQQEGDRTFVRMVGSANGTTIAVRTLMYDSRSGYSPVGVLIRTNGPATLQLRKNMALEPYYTLPVPNTHGQWRYLVYDMDLGLIRGSLAGDNLAYYTVVGPSAVTVDIDSINLQAKSQLTPPVFAQGGRTTLITVAGTNLSRSLAATDNGGDSLSYDSSGLPDGATLDSSTGTLSWAPTAGDVGTHDFLAVASDGTVDAVLSVTVKVVADRAAALGAALAGYDANQAYVQETLTSLTTAREAAEQAKSTGDDNAFAASVQQVQAAVAGLRLLSPRLSDGTLDFRGIMTSPTANAYAINNLADGDFNSTSGDLRAPSVLDFGAGFRVQADAFGLQARWNFANRSEGANVYGSNDGMTWTLLTARETTNTSEAGFAMETIPVREEVKDLFFRFLKIQVDDPGTPTDPAYPGISSFSELRIHGERIQTVQAISSVSLSSSNATPGRAVNGDTVTLDLVATEPLAAVTATIEGVTATVASNDSQHWRATAVLPENVAYGRVLQFAVDYTTAAGGVGSTVLQTTDGTSLALWNTHVAIVTLDPSWVVASTIVWPGTSTAAANGWKMFDGDVTTYTDTTTHDGWVTVTPPSGTTLDFNAVRIHPRIGFASRANGTVVQKSTDGGATWVTLVTFSGITTDSDWYLFRLSQHESAPMLRVLDEHGGNVNLAEVQLLKFDGTMS
jgi:Putative Ig domain